MSQSTQTIRVFISSPGDVAEEREKARQVISVLQRQYGDLVELVPVMWEDLAIPATASLQEGIDRLLEDRFRVDIAVFILWSRFGNPIGGPALKNDGSPYRSGTEREFDMMLAAHERGGGKRPVILAYTRDDDESFSRHLDLRTHDEDKLEEMIRQRRLVKQFIKEKFLDEKGRSLRAYHIYREPVGFAQRLHAHLRGVLFEFLSEREPLAVWTEPPYRGLEVFDIRHAPVFFGRDEETCALLQRLRERKGEGRAFVCVVGASGSGKSSLARAGVAATLIQRSFDDGVAAWRAAVFTPSGSSGNLFAGLARTLAEALPALRSGSGGLERFERCLAQGNDEAASILFESAAVEEERALGGAVRVLLVLDQMEELWSESWIAPEQREKFLKTIEWLAGDPRAAVLATLRGDFYSQAQASGTFLRLKGERGHFDLAPPGAASLHQLIVLPAQRAGLRFERDLESGRSLDQKILEDASRDSAALPLLQYALLELHARHEPASGLLTFSAYTAMGGVKGALARRAAQLFEAMPKESGDVFAEILPLLVSIEGGGDRPSVVRRGAPLAELGSTPAKSRLVEELVKARFLTTNAGTAMLSHEALLRDWDRVRNWIEENRALLRIRNRIEKYQAIWEDSGRMKSALLPAGPVLRQAQTLLERGAGLLDPAARAFVLASLARSRAALWSGLALAALVLVGIGTGLFFWWDHSRLKTDYFAQIVERFGVPEGVFPIDADRASRRAATYRVETSRGRVRRVLNVNGSGYPVPDPEMIFSAAIREFVYREDGSLQTVVFSNTRGAETARCLLSPLRKLADGTSESELKFEWKSGVPQGASVDDSNSILVAGTMPRSLVTVYRNLFSKDGKILRQINLDNYLVPGADFSGSWGHAFTYDEQGFQQSRTSLRLVDSRFKPHPDRSGVMIKKFRSGEYGNKIEVVFQGSNGEPVLRNGYAKSVSRFDEFGNEVERTHFDEKGEPAFHLGGYVRWTAKYDRHGNRIETAFFDGKGRSIHSKEGFAKSISRFDVRGREIESAYLGFDGRPVLLPDGYARKELRFDDSKNEMEEAYFGLDGGPVLHKDGYARKRIRLDASGNEIENAFFDQEGRPAALEDGWAKISMQHDENGNLLEEAFFGTDGKPFNKNGFVKNLYSYDVRGNRVECVYLAPEGEKVTMKGLWFLFENASVAKWVCRYDDYGNVVSCSFFVDGKRHPSIDRWASWDAEFNQFGDLVGETFFDTGGKPTMIVFGCARWTAEYDERGRQIKRSFFDLEGRPCLIKHGYAKVTRRFDKRGNMIAENFFGTDGAPVLSDTGIAAWEAKYDARGNRVETRHFGIDGSPTLSHEGWCREEIEYDERTGKEIRRTRYDTDGRTL